MREYQRIPARARASSRPSSRHSERGRSWQIASMHFTHNSTRHGGTRLLARTVLVVPPTQVALQHPRLSHLPANGVQRCGVA